MKYQIDCSGPSHGGGDALTGCHGCAFWFRWFTSSRILRAIAGLLLAFTTLLVISTPASGAQIADGEVTETILNTEGAEPHDRPYSLQATAAAGAITLDLAGSRDPRQPRSIPYPASPARTGGNPTPGPCEVHVYR